MSACMLRTSDLLQIAPLTHLIKLGQISMRGYNCVSASQNGCSTNDTHPPKSWVLHGFFTTLGKKKKKKKKPSFFLIEICTLV